jgi:glucose/arabinose dehydrogenase
MKASGSVRLTRIAGGFNFPTGIDFDESGTAYVAESGLPFGGAPAGGRVWRIGRGGRELVADALRPPVSGLTAYHGALYISESGHPARIIRIDRGQTETVLEGLPGPGNYHTNMTAFGPDGKLYFSQGAMTNTGVVGLDAHEIGWLRRLPHAHDVPGMAVTLTGINFETHDLLSQESGARALTGAFVPFGTETRPSDRVPAGLPCTAAVMRCDPDGGGLELVAWGLRNAFGLMFLPDGRLLATDQGADDRGSRPMGEVPDHLFEVRQGAWYGWPDFVGGLPVTEARFRPQRGEQPRFLLSNHDELPMPEQPLLTFPPHSCAVKLDTLSADHAVWPGQILVALFGDERPLTAPSGPVVGRALARIDPSAWKMQTVVKAPLARPIDVRVNPADLHAYVLDFGHFEMGLSGLVAAAPGTGTVYRLDW